MCSSLYIHIDPSAGVSVATKCLYCLAELILLHDFSLLRYSKLGNKIRPPFNPTWCFLKKIYAFSMDYCLFTIIQSEGTTESYEEKVIIIFMH